MILFWSGIVLLVAGYWLYSRLIERVVGVDAQRATPATTMADGVDYVPMKPWRIFLIQFLNIAGVGPICGAVMGAQFGPASYLWIVFGTIFAGAVHDFISGYISLRHKGCSLPEIHGRYLGIGMKQFMRGFTVILMILVGAVFVNTPASLIQHNLVSADASASLIFIWIGLIFLYYLLATMMPIDKIIGKIYPVFGILLLGMALALVVAFLVYQPAIPEVFDGLRNRHPNKEHTPLFPMMFISIACGAISGFHATQSPLMARCMVNEKQSRPIFYGAMVAEGVVALIWAAAANYFFSTGDVVHGIDIPSAIGVALSKNDAGASVVSCIASTWFPKWIAVITILGVIAAAITSGDTALRSARLIVADFTQVDQKPMGKRFLIAIPIFLATAAIIVFANQNKEGFNLIWRYFAWSNQVLATVTLWAVTVYLAWKKQPYILTFIPAVFMTMVTGCFLFVAENGGFGMGAWGYAVGALIDLTAIFFFFRWIKKHPASPDGEE